MQTMQTFVAPQYLENVHREFSGELGAVLDFLRHKLADMRQASAREYAELREAKSLISSMKYAGFTDAVRADELAWALQYAREAHARQPALKSAVLIDKTAQALHIDLSVKHAMPHDLARRISNELVLLKAETVPASSPLAHVV